MHARRFCISPAAFLSWNRLSSSGPVLDRPSHALAVAAVWKFSCTNFEVTILGSHNGTMWWGGSQLDGASAFAQFEPDEAETEQETAAPVSFRQRPLCNKSSVLQYPNHPTSNLLQTCLPGTQVGLSQSPYAPACLSQKQVSFSFAFTCYSRPRTKRNNQVLVLDAATGQSVVRRFLLMVSSTGIADRLRPSASLTTRPALHGSQNTLTSSINQTATG